MKNKGRSCPGTNDLRGALPSGGGVIRGTAMLPLPMRERCRKLPLTASQGGSERCKNPLCDSGVMPSKWHPKKYCCDRCRIDGWILAKAGRLLAGIDPERALLALDRGLREEKI